MPRSPSCTSAWETSAGRRWPSACSRWLSSDDSAKIGAEAAGRRRPVPAHSAGTGGWHEGEEMNPSAARQVIARGGDVAGFAARKLRSDQHRRRGPGPDRHRRPAGLRRRRCVPTPRRARSCSGEFGRLLATSTCPPCRRLQRHRRACAPAAIALVAAVDEARAGAEPLPSTTSTTRGDAATRRSPGSPTRSRTSSQNSPRPCCRCRSSSRRSRPARPPPGRQSRRVRNPRWSGTSAARVGRSGRRPGSPR